MSLPYFPTDMMGVVLHALPVRESRFDLPSVVTRDYVVVDQRLFSLLLFLFTISFFSVLIGFFYLFSPEICLFF